MFTKCPQRKTTIPYGNSLKAIQLDLVYTTNLTLHDLVTPNRLFSGNFSTSGTSQIAGLI